MDGGYHDCDRYSGNGRLQTGGAIMAKKRKHPKGTTRQGIRDLGHTKQKRNRENEVLLKPQHFEEDDFWKWARGDRYNG